jgi:PEP-CTERM motif
MNLLKSVQTSLSGKSKWALLGGVLLWMSISVTPPAHAIPTNYVLQIGVGSGFFTGTFTLDPSLTNPFTNWNISSVSTTNFSNPVPPFTVNASLGGSVFRLLQLNTGLTRALDFQINTSVLSWNAVDSKLTGSGQVIDSGTIRAVTSVPEPTALVLLAIGMLALAGSRWLPSRREN